MAEAALDLEKIKARRKKLALTQTQAAEKAGLSGPQQWSDIESGRRASITLDTLGKIATALGMKAKDLLA